VSQPPSSLTSPVFKPSGTALKTIPPLPAKRYTPQLVFITSRGTNSLLVGDNWTINITDAPPNSPVTVTGGMVPANVTTNMGSTDGNGRFTLSGRIDASSIGVWAESWAVGGQNVGSIGFSVSAAPSQSQPPPSPPPGSGAPPFQPPSTSPSGCDPTIDPTCVPSGTAPSSGTNFFTQSVSIGGLKIPVWGFIVAAGGAILLFMGESK
jgi:hypothetical protein